MPNSGVGWGIERVLLFGTPTAAMPGYQWLNRCRTNELQPIVKRDTAWRAVGRAG